MAQVSRAIASVFAATIASTIIVASAGCSGDDGGSCIELNLECTPQYEPTFDNVFTNTLMAKCALPGTACHAAEGAKGGLILDDADQAHSLLIGAGADVIPGDASCSELTARIESPDASRQMPPGAPLSAGERCSIEKWIEAGAIR